MAYRNINKKTAPAPAKFHVRRGDMVMVLRGDDKGKSGRVVSVDRTTYRAIVEGLNMVTRHRKPTAQDPQSGGRIQQEAPIHISKLMLIDPATGQPTRIGRKLNEEGKLQRYSKKTGELIPVPAHDGNPTA